MSLARRLTLGTADGMPRRRYRPKACPLVTAVRRELRGTIDTDALREATVALGNRPARLRPPEAFLYAEANRVLEELTGSRPGPVLGLLP